MSKNIGHKNLEKRKPFKKGDPRINRDGRPRLLVSSVIKDLKSKGVESVSQSDVKETFLMLINLNIGELKDIQKDVEQPAIVRIVAKEMLGGKGFEVVEKMLDRAMGKSEDSIKVDLGIGVSPKTLDDWYNKNRDIANE